MNWFLALNEGAFRAEIYADMIRVAVHTALTHTSLVPHLLYDGGETPLIAWLKARGVRIIPCRSSFHQRLAALSHERNDPNLLAIGAGALLRIDLPSLAHQHGIREPFALYTDIDVMFTSEGCAPLEALRPRYFAAAPDFDRGNHGCLNSGVMVMNLEGLRGVDEDFKRFVDAHLDALVGRHWDQGAYQRFFGRWSSWRALWGPRWDALPLEFNWRPYWGANPRAAIVHFHGPKPHDRERLRAGTIADHERWMTDFADGDYYALTDLWERALSET